MITQMLGDAIERKSYGKHQNVYLFGSLTEEALRLTIKDIWSHDRGMSPRLTPLVRSLAVVLVCLISFSVQAETLEETKSKAEQGNADAQYDLGMRYYNGQGVAQDYEDALKWYTKAAEQGNASAQSNLGVMYRSGYGILQDYAKAYMWFYLATKNGDRNKKFLALLSNKLLAKEMTSEQIAEAQKMAREWMEEHGEK